MAAEYGRTRSSLPIMQRRDWWPVAGIVAACLVILVGITALVRINPGARDGDVPTPNTSEGVQPMSVLNYLVGDTAVGPRLFSERVNVLATPENRVAAAVEAVVLGTTQDHDYRSAFPAGTTVSVTTTSDGRLLIDLGGIDPSLDYGTEGELAIAALNRAMAGVGAPEDRVIAVNGRPVARLLGQDVAMRADNDDQVLAPVRISAPVNDQNTGRSLAITGDALTPDGQITWAVRRDGAVVRRGVEPVGEDGHSFSVQVTLAPGEYEVEVSAEPVTTPEIEGRRNVDTKSFSVR